MENAELTELATFATVATHLSFRQAAIERGTSSPAVSHAIRSLETRVGVRLLHRTTRSVSLTEAGQRLFKQLGPALSEIRSAVDDLNLFRATPYGTVRLNVPTSVAPFILGEAVAKLLKLNPGLKVEVVLTDTLVDIVEAGFDAGIRFEEQLPQDMIAVRIESKLRFAVVGSPVYFKDKEVPRTPTDLRGHSCVRYAFPSGTRFQWEFAKAGELVRVDVEGPLTLDNQEMMVDAAVRGVGLAYVWEQRAAIHLRDGLLRRCLEDWCPVEEGLYLYFPSRRHQSAGLRALIDLLKA